MMRTPALAAAVIFSLLSGSAAVPHAASAGEADTARILREYVIKNRPWNDVEVRNISVSAEPPQGAPRRIYVTKGLPGRTAFSMEYENGTVVTASADIAAYEEVVVSARPLWKGRAVGEEDVCLTRMAIGRIPAGAFRDPRQIVGRTLTRSVGANLPIVERNVADSTLVKRGRKVTLLIETGGMRIATAGETRENAYVNTFVKAVNTASKRTVTGILTDEDTVRVGH